jgi:all-trans-nonaprenyl-diphosphate synthase
VKNAMFEYGRHLGLAFQVVDDILDFTQTSEQLGKPQARGLRGPRGQARCVVGARRRG